MNYLVYLMSGHLIYWFNISFDQHSSSWRQAAYQQDGIHWQQLTMFTCCVVSNLYGHIHKLLARKGM